MKISYRRAEGAEYRNFIHSGVFINKCLGFKWKFQMLRDKGLRLELSLYIVRALLGDKSSACHKFLFYCIYLVYRNK